MKTAVNGFLELVSSVIMLRSGPSSGLGHPGKHDPFTPHPGTQPDYASDWHDGEENLTTSASKQFGWIDRAWLGRGTQPGVWGQAYRLYGTAGFGVLGGLQLMIGMP